MNYEEIMIRHWDSPMIQAWHEYQRQSLLNGKKLPLEAYEHFRAGWDSMVKQLTTFTQGMPK